MECGTEEKMAERSINGEQLTGPLLRVVQSGSRGNLHLSGVIDRRVA